MKIASFNVNGIKARLHQLTAWLAEAQPDVAVLQEIKTVDEGFPTEIIEDLGWKVWTHGRKAGTASRCCRACPSRTSAAACPVTTAMNRPAGSRRW